jgi:hypothetical protein
LFFLKNRTGHATLQLFLFSQHNDSVNAKIKEQKEKKRKKHDE